MASIEHQIAKLEVEIETRKAALKELRKLANEQKLAAANSSKTSLREAD